MRFVNPFYCCVVFMFLLGCSGAVQNSSAMKPIEDKGLTSAKCGGEGMTARPLIIELPAADRVSLEARLRKGLVPVRFGDCKLEVLRNCEAPGDYTYIGTTRKNDVIRIRNEDELFAHMPLSAVSLEGRLAKAGELSVAMALVGMHEAERSEVAYDDLKGQCEGATHVITAVQVGAFELHTGNSAEIRAGVSVAQKVGVGSGSSSEREVLSQDGDPARCETSTRADARPPEGCGALLRLELSVLGARHKDACPEGAYWNGNQCVSKAVHCPPGSVQTKQGCVIEVSHACPAGTRFVTGQGCVPVVVEQPVATPPATPAPTPAPTTQPVPASGVGSRPSGTDGKAMCHTGCERQLRCESETKGMDLPEGRAYNALFRMCKKGCQFSYDNDFNRPRLRRCIKIEKCVPFMDCFVGEQNTDGDSDPFKDDPFFD